MRINEKRALGVAREAVSLWIKGTQATLSKFGLEHLV